MDTGSTVAVAGEIPWALCALQELRIDVRDRAAWITLAPRAAGGRPAQPAAAAAPPPVGAIAVACDGSVFRTEPDTGELVRHFRDPESRSWRVGEPVFAPDPAQVQVGGFTAVGPVPGAVDRVPAVAVDDAGVLAVIDPADGSVVLADLVERRVRGRYRPAAAALDLAGHDDGVLVLVADPAAPLTLLTGDGAFRPIRTGRPDGVAAAARPVRLAAAAGVAWILWRTDGVAPDGTPTFAGQAAAATGSPVDRLVLPAVPWATDLELDASGAVYVASGSAVELARWDPDDVRAAKILAPAADADPEWWMAPHYDGRGLALLPDGRVGYWTRAGLRAAFATPRNRVAAGRVTSYALDGGGYGRRWGRVFVDACLPPGTTLRVSALTADEILPEDVDDAPAGLPVSAADPATVPRPPSPALQDRFPEPHPVYRRDRSEVPWLPPEATADLTTFEAAVDAGPGRYLWLQLHLTGGDAASPSVLAVRVERPAPHLIDKLPAVYSAEPAAAAFLDRYLTLLSGPLADADLAAADRQVLLDAMTTPAELLPWLAGLLGVVLDDRWPLPARRRLVRDAVPLFRRRGTVGALVTMIELLTGIRPVLVEQFRYRGVGDGLRVDAGFDGYAHRFTVVVPGELDADRTAALATLLDVHRPAHTLVTVCAAGSGRIGQGLQLELTSVIGDSSGFRRYRVGAPLDGSAILGSPRAGLRVGLDGVGGRRSVVFG